MRLYSRVAPREEAKRRLGALPDFMEGAQRPRPEAFRQPFASMRRKVCSGRRKENSRRHTARLADCGEGVVRLPVVEKEVVVVGAIRSVPAYV